MCSSDGTNCTTCATGSFLNDTDPATAHRCWGCGDANATQLGPGCTACDNATTCTKCDFSQDWFLKPDMSGCLTCSEAIPNCMNNSC